MASMGPKVVKQLSFFQKIKYAFTNWYIYACGYRQLGLRAEDLIMDDVPDVAEAVKRLPRHEQDLRSFRLKRACDLTMKQIILPKDQWTKPEEDISYLFPYIDLVKKERLEREKWDHQ
ncbi:cytochrome b-c1 complex subunit 7-like [Acropora muricata]|uniref:cytochrome b-c1 complex subunit 7-like n=1 Tax=Acropora millepora TaxID=45264 RepID=UPI0010FCC2E2|nr:cytochrome b-c1 complex subunit 7-like [Acropora millepora]